MENIQLVYTLHTESFFLGMATSLAITLAVFGLKWEIRGHKKRKAERVVTRAKRSQKG